MSKFKTTLYLVFVIVVIVSYFFVIVPYQHESDVVSGELSRKSEEYSNLELIESASKRTRLLSTDFFKEMGEFHRQSLLVPDVQQEVVKLASSAGLTLGKVETLAEVTLTNGMIKISSFLLQATGEYSQLLKLLDEVALLPRLVNVQKLNVDSFEDGSREKNRGVLKFNIVFEYYITMIIPPAYLLPNAQPNTGASQ